MKDLREFISGVDESGELRVIEGADCDWEIGTIAHSVAQRPNPPALLFDRVVGYQPGFRVFTLPFATQKRRALVYGYQAGGTEMKFARWLRDRLCAPMRLVPPVTVPDGPVLENVHTAAEVDLLEFPTPQWHPLDGGRYIGTGDTVIMRDPDEGWVNVAPYRIKVHDRASAAVFIEPNSNRHGDMIRKKYWAKGRSCPIAVTCGGDPLLMSLSGLPVPWGTSEYDYAGWWQEGPVEVIKGPTTGLPIPARAEIALEGEILPPDVETRMEGPFSEFNGHFTAPRPEAVFRVQTVLHRNAPILFGVLPFLGPGVVCSAGQELYGAQVWSRLEGLVPGIQGVWMPPEFGGRAMVISLKQQFAGHAKQAAVAALAIRSNLQKYIIVVDDDVDPSNVSEVLFAMSYRAEPDEFNIINGWKGNTLDPRLPPERRAAGDITSSVAIINACKPFHWMKHFPPPIKPDAALREKARAKWGELAT